MVLLLPLYLMRAMAAGDVKLMAMTGAFLGMHDITSAFPYILLAGGVLALGTAWHQGKLRGLMHNVKMMLFTTAAREPVGSFPLSENKSESTAQSFDKLPYGVAIAAGTAAYLAVAHWA